MLLGCPVTCDHHNINDTLIAGMGEVESLPARGPTCTVRLDGSLYDPVISRSFVVVTLDTDARWETISSSIYGREEACLRTCCLVAGVRAVVNWLPGFSAERRKT